MELDKLQCSNSISRTGNTRSGGTESRQHVAERKGKNQFAQYPNQTAKHRTKKIFHSAQVVTESKQKSFSHVANTETKNRRRLRNSIGGKTNRRCEKGKVATTQTKTPPNLSMNKNLMGHRQALSAKAKTQKETQM
jgi:hypothetical protein